RGVDRADHAAHRRQERRAVVGDRGLEPIGHVGCDPADDPARRDHRVGDRQERGPLALAEPLTDPRRMLHPPFLGRIGRPVHLVFDLPFAVLIESLSNLAIPITRTSPSLLRCFFPSVIITLQSGQATATVFAPVATSSSAGFTLTREPIFSSMNIRPPPAPQQKPRFRRRSGSTRSTRGSRRSTWRGASYSPFHRPR